MKKENDILFHLFFKTINHLKHITTMNILDEANKIVNDRSEEKERAYGSFSEGMKRAAGIASGMTGKEITANDMFACMVALKFSRQSFNHKTDNMLDAVAYIGAWNNFIDEENANTKHGSSYTSTKEKVEADLKDILSETSSNFKSDLESEIFPPKHEIDKKHIKTINELVSYQDYLATKMDQLVKYVEHVASITNNFIKEYDDNFKSIKEDINKISTKIYMDSTD